MKKIILAMMAFVGMGTAQAGIVTNDTTLLSGVGHEQLSQWLGSDMDLTRVFAKGIDGADSLSWHAHVDNRGATFTVMEIFNGAERLVIGGYNEFDWVGHSSGQWVSKHNNGNFLFNLTDGLLFRKNGRNTLQAYNRDLYGATFGGGYDLHVNGSLSGGYANIGHSYGDESQYTQTAYRESFTGSYSTWTIGDYETFTVHSATGDFGTGASASMDEQGNAVLANDVSAPVGGALLALVGLGAFRRQGARREK